MKLNCSLACLIVQFEFVHRIQLEQSCRVVTCTSKQTSIVLLLNNDVYAVEPIVPSEVARSSVKVKGIQHMTVLRNSFNIFFLVKCKVILLRLGFFFFNM